MGTPRMTNELEKRRPPRCRRWEAVGVIEVDAFGGIVTLTGVVRTRSDRRRADLIARALGARSVDNRLHIEGEADATAS